MVNSNLTSVIVITGGLGFVGSTIVSKLNKLSINNIIIIDAKEKLKNTIQKNQFFYEFIDFNSGQNEIESLLDKYIIISFLHIGANTNVLIRDENIMYRDNLDYSKNYFSYCQKKNIPFIYTSSSAVYGNRGTCLPDNSQYDPLNIYAKSKLLFDEFVYENSVDFNNRVIGLRLFNVFGLGEASKGLNASIPYRFFEYLKVTNCIEIFDHKIARDYIWVDDVADIVIKIMFDKNIGCGIYNLGSGIPLSHEEIANLVIKTVAKNQKKPPEKFLIKTIPIPNDLKGCIQFYTKAEGLINVISQKTINPRQKIENYLEQLIYTYCSDDKD